MNALKRAAQAAPAAIAAVTLLVLGVYLLPHLAWFSHQPVLLLSRDAAQAILSSSGSAYERTVTRIVTKNVQGVVFSEDTLEDLEQSGRAFVASGEELLRLFKLQSVASYYVFEQVRDKNLIPNGSYVFFSEAQLFDHVFNELKLRLPPGTVRVFERGIFKGDASFPDNYILESTVPIETLKTLAIGWPVQRIREITDALKTRAGDTLWPVLWSTEQGAEVPGAVRLDASYLRFPYDSVRIVHDPMELVVLRRGAELAAFQSAPRLPAATPLVLSILMILAASVRLSQWFAGSILIFAVLVVVILALLPSHEPWVLEGLSALLPPAALISWMAAADRFRSKRNSAILAPAHLFGFAAHSVLFLAAPGWLLSTLFWQYPALPLGDRAVWGLLLAPLCSAALFLAVWAIEVSNRPIFPRHLRTGLELGLSAAILFGVSSAWILCLAAAGAWSRWFVLLDRTRGSALEDAPGNYAAFFVASALGLKLFFETTPIAAVLWILTALMAGAGGASAWLARTAKSA
ncbi:MAG: hypothetical protein A3G34_01315 [Candidatus Lindowbacteria bacterium RIFCSPLOWO2_12_FULL_62_27]|nr:MAG: hypothetical protein A3G34_01315 [Candidatus Lindowbacteria bacterium RIFCSPLOWO2_12_FULL_62_27]